MAQVTFTPGQAGTVRPTIAVMGPDHAPAEAKEVTVSMALPSLGVEPLERRATHAGTGQWVVESLSLPLPGRWQVRGDVLVSDFEKVTLEGEVEVRSVGPRASIAVQPEVLALKRSSVAVESTLNR